MQTEEEDNNFFEIDKDKDDTTEADTREQFPEIHYI